jgi:N-acetylglucosaminyldiphosphoundecaprenol N-acetyl-beta-D-mannosaminyltransferase
LAGTVTQRKGTQPEGTQRKGQRSDVTLARFGGVPLLLGTMDQAVELVLGTAKEADGTAFRLVNSYTLYCAHRDDHYARLLCSGGVNLIDGRPLAFLMRRQNKSVPVGQVRGPTLFETCLDRGRDRGIRHFLLGGTPDLLNRLEQSLRRRYPGLDVVGRLAPPFRAPTAEDRTAYLDAIVQAEPDIVWLGLGTPKQDAEGDLISRSLNVTTVGVGAAFDFSSGTKEQAPWLLRSLALEWAFRLWSEPRRLWRRYLFGNAHFLWQATRELLRRGR